ncbi:hypothetical protein LTR84_001541 [Exophiala bonariae]|uniref:Uncharacterized protein n=1 Tax=Exophiala bonariae TaxID=1690606 RepID=A0AAV9NCW2_9EURO|nr:hypothetical protein LTR84_001541 [Exophiala bonariae]
MHDGKKQALHFVDCPHLNTSGTDVSIHTPGSWKTVPFGRKKRAEKLSSKSMTLPRISKLTPIKTRTGIRDRKGFARRWKQLYKSNSWEMRAYTHHHGHRSSIGAGATAEFPDLECIPGIGNLEGLGQHAADIDGTSDSRQQVVGPTAKARAEGTQSAATSVNQNWIHTYSDCVGSISALKSDSDLPDSTRKDAQDTHFYSTKNRARFTNTDLRDSTVNFAAELSRKHEEAREGLLAQVSKMQN